MPRTGQSTSATTRMGTSISISIRCGLIRTSTSSASTITCPCPVWRDGERHQDAAWGSIYNLDYLKANVVGGEGYDWYYDSDEGAAHNIASPSRTAPAEPWVFRYKDLQGAGGRTGTTIASMVSGKPSQRAGCHAQSPSGLRNTAARPSTRGRTSPLDFSIRGVRQDRPCRVFRMAAGTTSCRCNI